MNHLLNFYLSFELAFSCFQIGKFAYRVAATPPSAEVATLQLIKDSMMLDNS